MVAGACSCLQPGRPLESQVWALVAPLLKVGVKLHPTFCLLKEKLPLEHPQMLSPAGCPSAGVHRLQGCWGDPSQMWRWWWLTRSCTFHHDCDTCICAQVCLWIHRWYCIAHPSASRKFDSSTRASNVITLNRRGTFFFPYWIFYCVQLHAVGENKSIKVPLACFNFCTCTHLIFTPWWGVSDTAWPWSWTGPISCRAQQRP